MYVKDEKIIDISKNLYEAKKNYDANGKWVLPGFIDPHVHFSLTVGNFTSRDDFETGSISAAFGGITTIIDFIDPAVSVSDVKRKFKERMNLAKDSHIDFSFHNTIANPEDSPEKIIKISKELGISSIKLFTTYSSTNRRTYDAYIFKLMELSKKEGIVVTIHAENDEYVRFYEKNRIPFSMYEESRPTIVELSEVIKLAQASEFYNSQTYIVHLSSGLTAKKLKEKFSNLIGKNLVLESCPHYFYFSKNKFKETDGYKYLMCPPLRSEEEVELLNQNIDMIQTIGTDHCPFNLREKKKKYANDMPLGIGGVEFSFVLMFTKFGEKIIDKFTKNVAKYYGLYPTKGTLIPGSDADIVIFDPEEKWTILKHHSASNYTPYEGIEVKGKIVSTILRGNFLVKNSRFVGKKIKGEFLPRSEIRW